jgi:hypothetical protein
MTGAEHCSFAGCDQAVVSSLEGKELCREHFISVCYKRLDRYAETHKGHNISGSDTESMRRFVQECVGQAHAIEHGRKDLDHLERALIVHIIERATDLGLHLRRSPRKTASVAVRLCYDKPAGGAWKEDTETDF